MFVYATACYVLLVKTIKKGRQETTSLVNKENKILLEMWTISWKNYEIRYSSIPILAKNCWIFLPFWWRKL